MFIPSMRREAYEAYMKTEHWRKLRAEKIALQPRCEQCDTVQRLQVHHIRYRNLFDVRLSDLAVLCEGCHDALHTRRNRRRKAKTYDDSRFKCGLQSSLRKKHARRRLTKLAKELGYQHRYERGLLLPSRFYAYANFIAHLDDSTQLQAFRFILANCWSSPFPHPYVFGGPSPANYSRPHPR